MKKTILLLAATIITFTNANAQTINPAIAKKVIPRTNSVIPGVNSPAVQTIKYSAWKSIIDAGMRTASFHFNNYDAAGVNHGDGFQFYKPNDIRLRIPLMGLDSVMEYKPLRYNPFTVYFKDINTNKVQVDAKAGKISFYVGFESNDIEIATNCVDNIICGGTGNPNFHINNLSFTIEMEPFAENGKIKYRNATGKVTANAGHDGFNFLITPLDPFAAAMNGPLVNEVSNKITEMLNNENTKNQISEKLYQGIVARRALFGFTTETPYFNSFYIDASGNLIYSIR
jgi:hypothetical protein